ncbi:hypothetical protein B3C1_01790 [Gallaecimonas xiamenensis 3-C-1]|uniref:TonB-dependent copper receptor n=2 Tax=Gallaecimonas TaxID=745410 RepID=K2JQA9_9GAMM|nr:hypothetical protein B3C1_01790 [Gallaecimonas xiamenensis 3-C-1]
MVVTVTFADNARHLSFFGPQSMTSKALLGLLLAAPTLADDVEHIIVTSEAMNEPGVVVTDPKQPRQPLPAQDGADYLKTIPGFNLTRKGGASSDPLFRGMGASRLNILTDGQTLLGGCPNRMDPPTAYLSPQSFDSIKVIKGPQSVLYGPAAATVIFERKDERLTGPSLEGNVSATAAQYGRREGAMDLTAGNQDGFARLAAIKTRSDNFKDGDGNRVNSHYDRWSTDLQLGWTPSDDSLLMLSAGRSDGEAAYADRMMDGAKYDRTNLGLRLRQDNLSSWLTRLDGQLYYNYVDHVMDNYSQRSFTPSMMMPNPSVANPDNRTRGGRLQADLALGKGLTAKAGLDARSAQHRTRSSMNQPMMPYQDKDRMADGRFEQWGLFAEFSYDLAQASKLHWGARLDRWQAKDQRQTLSPSMMVSLANPTYGQTRHDNLPSGFVRLEQGSSIGTWYLGLGHAERFPDYWEIIGNSRASSDSASAFHTQAEKNTQLDGGWILRQGDLNLSLSLFFSRVDDFILIERQAMGADLVRNIDADSYGGEATLGYQLTPAFKVESSLAYSRGRNKTDDRALAQQPPLELRLSGQYRLGDWNLGALWRLVVDQSRVAVGQGNVIGLDTGPTAGFGTLSLNGSWQPDPHWQLSFGVDNLLDKRYAEHLSRAGAAVAGFEQADKVNEPGRTAWVKADYRF